MLATETLNTTVFAAADLAIWELKVNTAWRPCTSDYLTQKKQEGPPTGHLSVTLHHIKVEE